MWMRALIALVSILIGIGAIALTTPTPTTHRFKNVRRPGGWDRLASGLCIVLTLGVFYLILAVAPRATGQFSEFLHAHLNPVAAATKTNPEEAMPTDAGQTSDSRSHDFEISTLFDPSGTLVPSTARLTTPSEPQVSLKTSDWASALQLRQSGHLYLSAFSHHAFDGKRWTSPRTTGPQKLTQGPDGLIHLQASDDAPDYRYTIFQHRKSDGRDTLNALHGVRFIRLPEIVQVNPGTWLLPASTSTSSQMDAYQAGSSPVVFEDLIASNAAIEPGTADPAYLAPTTNPGLRLQLENLSSRFRTADPPRQRLLDLQRWFATSFTYSQQVAYPDNGKTVMENFLANPECNNGFCVHFASAAVLLLRELGIPARMSYGWSGGLFYQEHDQFVFDGEHAHAWAEVYLKDHGWVVFDPTPSSSQPQPTSAPPGAIPPALEKHTKQTAPASGGASAAPWIWMAAALGVGAAILLMMLLRKFHKLTGGEGFDSQSAATRTTPGYLQLFHQACNRMGHPKPAGRTWLHHLDQLQRAGITIPFADELLTYHYNVAYRDVPRDPRREKHLCARIHAPTSSCNSLGN